MEKSISAGMSKALEFLASKQERPPNPSQTQAGNAWTEHEEQQLVQAFDVGTAVAEIARAHQRTRGAITSRLIRLGRLQPGKFPST